MFETERQLIEFFKRLQNHITNVREVLGDQVAEFHLTNDHGVRQPADDRGHFTFFDLDDFDWKSSIKRKTPLPPHS